jgi:hypothetical protein
MDPNSVQVGAENSQRLSAPANLDLPMGEQLIMEGTR